MGALRRADALDLRLQPTSTSTSWSISPIFGQDLTSFQLK